MLKLVFLVVFALSFPVIVHISFFWNYWIDYLSTFVKEDLNGQAFDFIIIGAGSAGAVVAKRLSNHNKVLLLEAGGDPVYLTSIPGLAMNFFGFSQIDYNYKTLPQENSCLGMVNNQSTWTRGKALGGSSELNYMFYLRGNPNDYNNWANLTGDVEWNYENVLPFFKKSIAEYKGKYQTDKINYGNSDYGFLSIERRKWRPMAKEFFEACEELRLVKVDANGPQRSGFADVEVTQKNSQRGGTYKTILEKLSSTQKNLFISRYSHAIKIKLSKRDNQAEGVWYFHHGVLKFARVRKEIVVSGGTIDSPKLLMLSGIGPEIHLKSIGIKPKVNLPVGQNLQDHVGTTMFPFLIDKPVSFILERDLGPAVFQEYFNNGEGPLAVPSAVSTQGFLRSSFAKKDTDKDWPDIQFFFIPSGVSAGFRTLLHQVMGYRSDFLKSGMEAHEGKDAFMFFLIASRPKSIGEITLKNKNPFEAPLIQPNYFTHPQDMKVIIEGIHFLMKLAETTKSFKSLGTKYTTIPVLGCENNKYRSDAYWECFVRHNTVTMWHPVGTCRAGKSSDPRSVVNSKLRVLKTKGLRVIDASIMPALVNANTNAPTIMIGEKGSYFIQQYWAQQYKICDRIDRFLKLDHNKCYYSQFP